MSQGKISAVQKYNNKYTFGYGKDKLSIIKLLKTLINNEIMIVAVVKTGRKWSFDTPEFK
jgi:hypothetical protein